MAANEEDTVVTDHVELTLPARPDLLVLARMTVGAVAARAEMAVDDIEDLRLAIDELCLSVTPVVVGGSGPRITTDAAAPTGFVPRVLVEEDGTVMGRWLRSDVT